MPFPWQVATLPPEVLDGWEASPHSGDTVMAFGSVRSHVRSWARKDREASVRIVTQNSPPTDVKLGETAANAIRDALWAMKFRVADETQGRMKVQGDPADIVRWHVRPPERGTVPAALGVLPFFPSGEDLYVQLVAWESNCPPRFLPIVGDVCPNHHAYIGVTTESHVEAVLDTFPGAVRYE